MNKIMKLCIPSLLLMMSLASSNAQTSFTQTNVVMNLNVKGVIYEQSGADTVTPRRVTNKDLIKLVADAQGISVGTKPKLLVAVPIGASEAVELPRPEVRISSGSEETAVPDHFNLFPTSTTEGGTDVINVKGRKRTENGVWQMSFDAGDAAFEALGFATLTTANGSKTTSGNGKFDLAGTGTSHDNPAVVKVIASTSGKKIETIDVPGE